MPGMMASKTRIPVIGVPVQTKALSGVDSLYSIVQMPKGYPVATMAIGAAGAANAGLLAAGILALQDPGLAARLDAWPRRSVVWPVTASTNTWVDSSFSHSRGICSRVPGGMRKSSAIWLRWRRARASDGLFR